MQKNTLIERAAELLTKLVANDDEMDKQTMTTTAYKKKWLKEKEDAPVEAPLPSVTHGKPVFKVIRSGVKEK